MRRLAFPALNAFTASTTRSMVPALWSAVKIDTGITLQSRLRRPLPVGTGETDCTSM